MEKLVQTKKISELQEMEFRKQCQEFVSATAGKILLKCPLRYGLVRSANCFDPRILANKENIEVCILDILVDVNWVKESKCDILLEYCRFIEKRVPCELERFENFDPGNERVDTLFYETVGIAPDYSQILRVVKLVLILSHGQAGVERGFSLNRNVEKQNLKEETFVSLRVICDHFRAVGGLANVKTDKAFLTRSKYRAYLDDQKHQQKTDAQPRKRKHMYDKIDAVKEKKCIEKRNCRTAKWHRGFCHKRGRRKKPEFTYTLKQFEKNCKGQVSCFKGA